MCKKSKYDYKKEGKKLKEQFKKLSNTHDQLMKLIDDYQKKNYELRYVLNFLQS